MSRLYTYRRPVDFRARNVPIPFDSLVVSEDFTTDPRPPWANFGGGTKTVTGGIHRTVTTTGADGSNLAIGHSKEFWWQLLFRILSGHTGWDAGEKTNGSGLTTSSISSALSTIGIINDAGTLKFRSDTREDGGDTGTIHNSPTFIEDIWYTFTGHVIFADGVGANNGIYQQWIDDTQVLNISSQDNDATKVGNVIVGTAGSSGITSYTIECDDVLVRTTVEIPRPAAGGLLVPLAFDHLAMMGHN